jgi:1-acylglycerol-3-phosphate O-acyltransferase
MIRALSAPQSVPPPGARMVDLATILRENPDSSVVVFPECTTTNGRGILQLSPSLVTAPASTKIFPVNMRYTPADITTPIPASYFSFLWKACAKPAHCIRVRIAEYVYNTSATSAGLDTNGQSIETAKEKGHALTPDERKVLDKIGESLARLGRVKRLALGVEDKQEFVGLRKRK